MNGLQGFFQKSEKVNLVSAGVAQTTFGEDVITYQFEKVHNVANLANVETYLVKVRHRVLIPGSDDTPGNSANAPYSNYPALLKVRTGIATLNNNGVATLKRIFPRTLNSSVDMTSSQSDGTSSSENNQHTAGSSSTNVNTFGVSLSGGFFGDLPVGSITAGYSHSWEKTRSDSSTSGTASGRAHQADMGDSMSIKDWSSYGYLRNVLAGNNSYVGERAEWVWAQAFPWDVLQYASGTGSVKLPQHVQDRLYRDLILLPPSHLSLFGLDFTMMAEWEVSFPAGLTAIEQLTFTHEYQLDTASHVLTSGPNPTLSVTYNSAADTMSHTTAPVDIATYALLPLAGSTGNGAGIGFRDHLFDIVPASATDQFKIVSRANNLLVTGTAGFDSTMTANLQGTTSASLTVTFKTADVTEDFSLLLMHWIGSGSAPCQVTCTINGNWTEDLYVEHTEGRGGQNNLSSIELRNTDLKSANFHDYLVVGTNTIVITVTPAGTATSAVYRLSALAIA